jgi:histidyl-tRNA synthetase
MPDRSQAPKGTLDVLPPGDGGAPFDSAAFAHLVAGYAELMERAGFGLIVGPMFEDLAVYARVGATTDIVRKEMYDFHDKSNPPHHLALRPDSTPSVVRAFVEHRPILPWRVWYLAPHFRYDNPQAGRYRQHHSVGVEVLGVSDADVDTELIALSHGFLTKVAGLERFDLLVNTIGDDTCRPPYRQLLVAHITEREDGVCDEHRDHWRDNPMRLFDCKRDACKTVMADAPRLLDHLCDGCGAHFERTKAGLDALKIEYRVEPRLIRGQDYYTRTTFEYEATSLDQAQLALGGGGRYDGLVEAAGGPADTPGIGFGLGIERILLAMDAEHVDPATWRRTPAVFVVDTTPESPYAAPLTHALRAAGISAIRGYDQRSYKAQTKQALRANTDFSVVIEGEPARAQLRTVAAKGEPTDLPADVDAIVAAVRERLDNARNP